MELNLGKIKVNIEGESHSKRLDVKVSGLPSGEVINLDELQVFMNRRHGDDSYLSELCCTPRKEADEIVIDSGVANGVLSEEILAHIDNTDVKSSDYDSIRTLLRPGHADLGAFLKYGRDGLKPGGGEFSGRMTAGYCIAGGIAKQILTKRGISVDAYVLQLGGMTAAFLDEEEEQDFIRRIEEIKEEGDSCGGIVGCIIKGCPGGIGGPGISGLESDFARAMLAIPSAKGIEFGSGFEGTYMTGSANNDDYYLRDDEIITRTNKQGGISGGISTGMNITMNVAFKPVPSIGIEQRTVDIEKMEETSIKIEGRHDVCIVPRVLPVVESMAALVLLSRLEEQ